MYDISRDEWRAGPPMLSGRMSHSCIVIETEKKEKKVLVVGGDSYNREFPDRLKSIEVFDIATQTWSYGIDQPFESSSHTFDSVYASSLVGTSPDSIYAAFLIGGWQKDRPLSNIFGLTRDLTEWKNIAGSFATPRSGHVALKLPQTIMESC